MHLISILLFSATILRNVSYLDVAKREFMRGDVVIDNGSIHKVKPAGKARAAGKDFIIDAERYYLVPPLADIWVFLNGSPGGNIWVNEFIPDTRKKAELALAYCGVHAIGAPPPKRPSRGGLTIHALGPWIRISSSQPVTPYGLEEWNPYVFRIMNLSQISDIDSIIGSAQRVGALGVVLSMPRTMVALEPDRHLVKELRRALMSNGLIMFGLSYGPVEERVLDFIAPDVLVGWLPEFPHQSVRFEMPLFLDSLARATRRVPHATRLSLDVYYAFTGVGVTKEAWKAIDLLSAHNVRVLKNRPAAGLLLGSGAGFPQRFFGPATIHALHKFVEAGFSNLEALAIATRNSSEFLGTRGAITEGSEANLTLLGSDPAEDLWAFTRPVALFRKGRLITAGGLEYEIDSLSREPLVIGKPLVIADFKKETTVLGSSWHDSYLSFGLDGKWERNTLTGKKARSHDELWSKGGIISFVSGDTSAWDFSFYEAFKLAVEACNTPCSVYVLSKATHWGESPGAYLGPESAEVILPLASPGADHVQGIRLKPMALGEGEYVIALRELSVIEPEQMPLRVAANLQGRIEEAVNAGDTVMLWQARTLVDLGRRLYPAAETRYLQAYVNYRLATMLPRGHHLKGRLIDEALEAVADEPGIEMQIVEYALMGLAAGINPLKAFVYARKLNELADRLQEEGKENPRALLVLGAAKLFTPPMFGGSPDRAVTYLEQSVALFKTQRGFAPYAWGRGDAMVFLSEAYKKVGRSKEARDVLAELRTVAPFYSYGAIRILGQ
ncbi:hypothetical protein IBX73_07850 [candidate division WOR-3 bacterium]|nr:hypothetical protein [candidate division WOR-3 bacterium]